MYPHAENEIATSSHFEGWLINLKKVLKAEYKNTKIAFKVKNQGQMSPTYSHF